MVDTVKNSDLIRSIVHSQEIKDVLQEELSLDPLIRWITDFPDGDTLKLPTLSEMTTDNYREGEQIKLQDTTTGAYELVIDKYYQSGLRVPEKFMNDTFYVGALQSRIVPKMMRAIMEQKESDIAHLQAKQTASNPNTINGVDHRFVATGSNDVITLKDVMKAKLALDKARVSKTGRIGVVDCTVSHELLQIADFTYQDRIGANDKVESGFGTTIAIGRLGGFELRESHFLDVSSETIVATAPTAGSRTGGAAAVNMFVGDEAFIGAMRAAPDLNEWYDENTRSQCYHVTIRYGLDLYRPEALVCVLTD